MPGHHLKNRKYQIFVMECDGEESVDEEEFYEAITYELTDEFTDKTPTISINALSGSTTLNCMRLIGLYGKRKLFVLIDPGSTHNFLDLAVAKEIGYYLEVIKPKAIFVVNGSKMLAKYKCSEFTWKVQGYTLSTEVRTLPLDCCDLVLGVQWLTTLGPIWWDFSNLIMEFNLGGVKHIIRGVTKGG